MMNENTFNILKQGSNEISSYPAYAEYKKARATEFGRLYKQ